jgi:hypothetical protein
MNITTDHLEHISTIRDLFVDYWNEVLECGQVNEYEVDESLRTLYVSRFITLTSPWKRDAEELAARQQQMCTRIDVLARTCDRFPRLPSTPSALTQRERKRLQHKVAAADAVYEQLATEDRSQTVLYDRLLSRYEFVEEDLRLCRGARWLEEQVNMQMASIGVIGSAWLPEASHLTDTLGDLGGFIGFYGDGLTRRLTRCFGTSLLEKYGIFFRKRMKERKQIPWKQRKLQIQRRRSRNRRHQRK